MKKKLLAILLAGMMIGSLSACGGTAEVTEEPPTPVIEDTEEPVEDEDVIEDEEEEIVSPDHIFDIPESVWIYGKSHDIWFVTEGLVWYAVGLDGETVVEGTLYAESEDRFDVCDRDGEILTTFTITDEGDLLDENFPDLYYQVGHLPARFPNELAEEIGFNDIAGEWVYQEQNIDNPELYDDIAFICIYQDGTYEIRFDGDDYFREGVILIELEEFPDEDSYTPIYSFFEDGNNYWQGCYTGERSEGIIYFGNGASARLIPAEGQG